MKVRIVRQPKGTMEGLSLQVYHAGQVYNVPPTIAAYLVAEGFAIIEMRTEQEPRSRSPERRRRPT